MKNYNFLIYGLFIIQQKCLNLHIYRNAAVQSHFTRLEMLWLSDNRIGYSKENLKTYGGPIPCLPLSVLSFPFLYLSIHLKVCPFHSSIQLGGLGSAVDSWAQRGLDGAPAEIDFWCILGLKIWHLVAISLNDFPEN